MEFELAFRGHHWKETKLIVQTMKLLLIFYRTEIISHTKKEKEILWL